jgi:hypothetical protein
MLKDYTTTGPGEEYGERNTSTPKAGKLNYEVWWKDKPFCRQHGKQFLYGGPADGF